MSFIKTESNSFNRLLIAYKYYNKMTFHSNVRTMFSMQRKAIPKHLSFSSTKPQICTNFCQNQLKYNLLEHKTTVYPNVTIIRCLSKGKDRPKEKKKSGKPKVVLTDEEMSELIPIQELRTELDSVVEKFKNDLISNVNVRSNPQSIDK